MQGKAIDFRLAGVKLRDVRKAAISLKAGGVGYYPESNFVHIDSGSCTPVVRKLILFPRHI